METALINMFMGMGVVFSVLILISLIINCFKIFPYLEEKFKKRKENQAQNELEQSNIEPLEKQFLPNFELIAVITAAIANQENCNVKDFVVKSIKRR